jgi:hypothetical protein
VHVHDTGAMPPNVPPVSSEAYDLPSQQYRTVVSPWARKNKVAPPPRSWWFGGQPATPPAPSCALMAAAHAELAGWDVTQKQPTSAIMLDDGP